MALPSSGAISLSQVNTELGLSSTAAISLNDSAVRTLFGVASGSIAMSSGYGKANKFLLTISSALENVNLRSLLVANGWDQTKAVEVTINSGVNITSNSTSTAALTISGSFPGGIMLINRGRIQGKGGLGGSGQNNNITVASGGSAGSSGGLALLVQSAATIDNLGATIAGGGGGGGGGPGLYYQSGATYYVRAGGGGGGGGGNGAAGSGGTASGGINYNGAAGSNGTVSAGGAGGNNGSEANIGGGGSGGSAGASGSSGTRDPMLGLTLSTGYQLYSGGSAGAAVSGNANITWVATGTRLGAIT